MNYLPEQEYNQMRAQIESSTQVIPGITKEFFKIEARISALDYCLQ